LDGLSAMTALTELQAPGNALVAAVSPSSSSSSSLTSLRVLNLAGNPSPSSLRELDSLAVSFPALEELWLVDPLWPASTSGGGGAGGSDSSGVGGCPAAALGGYSSAALAALPASLRRLDGLTVSEAAREAAVEARRRRRLGRELLRRELERRVLPRLLLASAATGTPTILRAKRALARALRRFEFAGDTHGCVRIEEVGLGEDDEEEGSSLLLRLLSPSLPSPLEGAAAAPTPPLSNLSVWSVAHVHSRGRALAFEARLRQRLLPAGTAYFGPGTPAVAAVAARGGVLPAALAVDGGRHVRTLFYVLPGRGGSQECTNNDDDADDEDDHDMQALEAIAELGFAGAAASASAVTGAPAQCPHWVRLLPSLPSRFQGRPLAVMVVRAFVGAEGPGGHVRLRTAQGQQGGGGAAEAPPALLADLPGSAVAAVVRPESSSSGGGGDDEEEVWWHRDPELVLPVGILELSDEGGGGGGGLAVVAAGSSSLSEPTASLPRAVPSARSLQVANLAICRAVEGGHNLADSSSAETASALLLPPLPLPMSLPALSPHLLSLDLGRSGLSGPCPQLWRALGRVSMLTRLDLGGNVITALCGEEDEEEAGAATASRHRRRPLLPALCILGLESNALRSLRGLDRLAGPALEQLHARDNPGLASPADVLGPLTAPVVLVPAATGARADAGEEEERDDAGRLTAHFLPHPFPRLEVLDLRGSALASGEGVPQSLLCAREQQQQQEEARQQQTPPLMPAELRARDYRLYALHLLLRGSASCLSASDSRGVQTQPPPLLVLDGQAVCPRERARAALAYGGLLTREALAGLEDQGVLVERLSLRGWRLSSTGAVFSSPGDDELPLLLPPQPPQPPFAASRLLDLDLSSNAIEAVNPHLSGLGRLTRLVLDRNWLGGGLGDGRRRGLPGCRASSPLPPLLRPQQQQHPLSFERTLPCGGSATLLPALVSLSIDRCGLDSLAPLRLGALRGSLRRLSARDNRLSRLSGGGGASGVEAADATGAPLLPPLQGLASLTGLEELLLDGNRLRRWHDTAAVLEAVAAAADDAAAAPPLLRLGLSRNGIRSLRDMPRLARVWELRIGDGRMLADPSDAEALAAAAPMLRSVWVCGDGGGGGGGRKSGSSAKPSARRQQQEQTRQEEERQRRVLLAARCGPRLEQVDGVAVTAPEREAAAALTAAERAAAAAAAAAVAGGGDAAAAASAAAAAAAAAVAVSLPMGLQR
jgi:Leucine-rich repeat (LRR) protein